MATVAAPSRASKEQECSEDRFQRLLSESRKICPESIGTREEIKRDALATFKSWSKLRRRARSA